MSAGILGVFAVNICDHSLAGVHIEKNESNGEEKVDGPVVVLPPFQFNVLRFVARLPDADFVTILNGLGSPQIFA